jgi:hypothetical protein
VDGSGTHSHIQWWALVLSVLNLQIYIPEVKLVDSEVVPIRPQDNSKV